MTSSIVPGGRAAELIDLLQLTPHPEGGHYREVFRAPEIVQPHDGRPSRSALTTIDFLLVQGECSAWHRVTSGEVWHLLEGRLRLWLMSPSLDAVHCVDLGPVAAAQAPRHVVPAHWWQAAEPVGELALVGATVGPGFDFADFGFLREEHAARQALQRLNPSLLRLL